MKKKDYSISIFKANIYSIPILIFIIFILIIPYFLYWGNDNLQTGLKSIKFYVLVPILLVGGIIHELIHAISYVIFGKAAFKEIKIGFHWKNITPYAHCTVPISASAYRISAVLPGIILGFIPGIFSIILGNSLLLVIALFFSIVSCGDFLIIWLIRKVKKEQLVQDHPEKAGCLVIEKE